MHTDNPYDVAAYVWPAFTGACPRARIFWPEGMGEWETVRAATAKFPGHAWPRRPAWGYADEADPQVMAMHIDVARDHGVNVFAYDWYWYDGRPFLEACLKDGFLRAPNTERMRFYLMWANHDANTTWDRRLSHMKDNVVWRGEVDDAEFRRLYRYAIPRYLPLPHYYRIDNRPVFAVYDAGKFIRGLGGLDAARRALDGMREEAARAGLPGLHMQMILWSWTALNVSGVDGDRRLDPFEAVRRLGFDSVTHYHFVHFTPCGRAYREILADVREEWARIDAECPVPYFPHISLGWDNNPRFRALQPAVTTGVEPACIEEGFRLARAYVDAHPGQARLATVNSWNEWTEASYLQPDDRHGYGYLDVLRRTFLESASAGYKHHGQ